MPQNFLAFRKRDSGSNPPLINNFWIQNGTSQEPMPSIRNQPSETILRHHTLFTQLSGPEQTWSLSDNPPCSISTPIGWYFYSAEFEWSTNLGIERAENWFELGYSRIFFNCTIPVPRLILWSHSECICAPQLNCCLTFCNWTYQTMC